MQRDTYNSFDLAFQQPDVGYNIFFKFYETSNELEQDWLKVQEKAKEVISSEALADYNSYLVLGIPVKDLPSTTEMQRIVFDQYVCRKLIFPVDSSKGELRRNILRLPFYPLDISQVGEYEIPKGVIEALSDTDFDVHLVRDISGRVSPSAVLAKIVNREYEEKVKRAARTSALPLTLPPQGETRRLRKLVIDNFRGIGRKISLGLDADVVVIYGPNGTGKTSIFDAIEWGITGQVERLQRKPIKDTETKVKDVLINVFHRQYPATVVVEIGTDGDIQCIERVLSLSEPGRPKVKIDGRNASDKTIIAAVTGNESLSSRITRVERFRKGFVASHTLKQDILTRFIRDTYPEDRYNTFSYLTATQDFVSFKEKTENVVRLIEQEIAESETSSDKTSEQAEDFQQDIADKEKEIAHLSEAIASFSKASLVTEIVKLIGHADFPISKNLVTRLKEPTEELAQSISDISSKYAESTRKDIEALSDLVKLGNSVSRAQHEKKRTEDSLNLLVKEDKKTKEQTDEIRSQISKARRKLSVLERSLQTSEVFVENIGWLIETKPSYERKSKRLEKITKELKDLSEKEEKLRKEKREVQQQLTQVQRKVQTRDKELLQKEDVQKSLDLVLDSLAEWKESVSQLDALTDEAKQTERQLTLKKKNMEQTSGLLATLVQQARETESQVDLEIGQHDQKAELIGRLKEYIDTSKCPVCGHDWQDRNILLSRAEKEIRQLPESLRALMTKQKKLVAEKHRLQLRISRLKLTIKELESKRELLASEKRRVRSKVTSWHKQFTHLGLDDAARETEAKGIPERKSLEQYKINLQKELEALHKDRLSQDKHRKRVTDGAQALEDEIADVRTRSSEAKNTLNSLNQSIQDIRKEMKTKELTEFLDRDVSSLEKTKEDHSIRLRVQISKKKSLKKTLEGIESRLIELELKSKHTEGKLTAYTEKLEEYRSSQKDFLRTARRYVPRLEQMSLSEVLGEIKGLIDLKTAKYEQYLSLVQRTDNLKKLITSDSMRKSIREIRKQLSSLENKRNMVQTKLRMLARWRNRLDALQREAATRREQQEESHLGLFNPTAKLIYQRLSPHPLLGDVEISIGHGRLKIISKVKPSSMKSNRSLDVPPSHVFSEAQLNTLAISIFLASALQQRWSRFGAILIDDPVQNMDDLNSYAFLDLILGLADGKRQFIISTCSVEFYRLMLLKFSCLNRNTHNRFLAYRLQGVTEDGPAITQDAGMFSKKGEEKPDPESA